MTYFDIDAAQQLCDRPGPRLRSAWEALDYLPAALAEIRRLQGELRMAYKKGADTAVNNVQLRAQVQRVEALCSELNDEQARGGEYPVRELTVERIRAALGEPTTCLCNQPAPSCPVHRAAGYSQEDQDNLGQCGR